MLKLQYCGHLMPRTNSLEKTLMLGKTAGRGEEKGVTKDEIVGWHLRFKGHEFEQTPGDGERQESLACCSPWGRKRVGHNLLTKQLSLYIYIYTHTMPQISITLYLLPFYCSSVTTKSCPTLQPGGLQRTRLPCPSPSPGVCSNSCPLSQ